MTVYTNRDADASTYVGADADSLYQCVCADAERHQTWVQMLTVFTNVDADADSLY